MPAMQSKFAALVTIACLLNRGFAQQSTGVPTITVKTAIPSATAPTSNSLPSQAPLPPKQAWCPSEIFCAGPLLQTVNVAKLYPDDKTFVDKPTSKGSQQVLDDFKNLTSSGNVTYGQVVNFVQDDFKGEGLELQPLALSGFKSSPEFLKNVSVPIVKGFAQTVHGYWTQLIRGTNSSILCPQGPTGCESSLIPLNHTFVVPGGRFREQYYWDSFWILEGLIQSELFDIAKDTLQNFMDELDRFGFIPNGGRIYYLNRSQPPVFIRMLSSYVAATGDRSILQRGLPLAEKELQWWVTNRSVNVTSSFSQKTHLMYRYNVNNTAPRPESYLTDYTTANVPADLNDTQKGALYAELASGAESGWDYTARWLSDPSSVGKQGLRTLNVRNTIAVDLNSLLYRSHLILAGFYKGTNDAAATRHTAAAEALRAGILDLCWDGSKLAFYDYNLGTNKRNDIFSAATFYPLWNGIIPDDILGSQEKAFGFFSSLNLVMNRYNGTFPATFIDTGFQWDAPNTWPPHQYIILQALRALPANITTNPLPTPGEKKSSFDLIPSGQLGIKESDLPGQPVHSGNATHTGPAADINALNGTVHNGGNATSGEGWAAALQRELANRYVISCYCSWLATGGSIQGLVPRLSDAELNVTQSTTNTGNMFEKFSIVDIDSAGRGGEYTVQAGFGWTNGALLWVSSVYGDVLVEPKCPSLLDSPVKPPGGKNSATVSSSVASKSMALAVAGLLIHLLL